MTADVVDSTVPPGSVLTTANDPQSVSVPAGGTGRATPVGFQYLSQQTGTVSGHIYNDVNGNGVQDPGEPGLPGVTVVVTDNQGTTHTVVTNPVGDYQTAVPIGTATAKVDESTLPSGSVRTGGSDPQTVTVTRNADTPTQPIGYQQRGTVTGHVFNDVNANGVQDLGEPNLPGVTVNVTDSLGTVHPLTTDGSGNWSVVVSGRFGSRQGGRINPSRRQRADSRWRPANGDGRWRFHNGNRPGRLPAARQGGRPPVRGCERQRRSRSRRTKSGRR